MSETMDPMATELDQHELAQQLLAQAREQGIELVGRGGLLNRLTKNVLETALEAEMDEHLGYGKHDVSGRGRTNQSQGTIFRWARETRSHARRGRHQPANQSQTSHDH
ncbi:transposase [Arthrobacter sp. ok362]|uniref:transposase n=1 Tax=Arthrobacter sp. ok362 TaxID=1761745 RepID=UPI000884A27E|nr:transposase [Arthrobacter sp. ok362]SDL85212.1 Transposase, Mutator family [Arthrobacter sp. ok362]